MIIYIEVCDCVWIVIVCVYQPFYLDFTNYFHRKHPSHHNHTIFGLQLFFVKKM